MTLNRKLLFLIAAIICIVIALLIAVGVFSADDKPWVYGGLLAFFLVFLP